MAQGCAPLIERLCQLAGVSRAGYYCFWRKSAPRQLDTTVRDAIQELAVTGPIVAIVRSLSSFARKVLVINQPQAGAARASVLRLTRQDNLLCLRRRAFVPATTDSKHGWPVVANLARGMRLSGLDQLWVADITYIGLQEEFAIWRSSSTPSAAAPSVGRWRTIWRPAWPSRRSGWRSRRAGRRPAA